MKRSLKILLPVIIILILALGAAGWYFSGLVVNPRIKTYEETYRIEIEKGRIQKDRFESLPFETVYIQSPHGYRLHALYLPAPAPGKTVIFTHGFSFSLLGSVKYMEMFRRRGFGILMYDHRHHGRSGGDNVTFGFTERDDLRAVVDWVIRRAGPGTIIGVHGESIGAAVALQHAAIDDRVSFCISDGSFTSLPELLKFRLKSDFGLPAFPLYHAASFFSKLRAGFYFSEISPIAAVARAKAPLFFIHGGADTYIPTEMGRRLFQAYGGKKRIYICPGAKHSESFWTDREEYDRQVGKFLGEIGVR
jgi:hypothetical protein